MKKETNKKRKINVESLLCGTAFLAFAFSVAMLLLYLSVLTSYFEGTQEYKDIDQITKAVCNSTCEEFGYKYKHHTVAVISYERYCRCEEKAMCDGDNCFKSEVRDVNLPRMGMGNMRMYTYAIIIASILGFIVSCFMFRYSDEESTRVTKKCS